MTKKKICLVIPSLHAGGMERVMSVLAGYFCSKSEFEVHLIMYGIKPELFYTIPSNISIHKPSFIFNNKFRIWYSIKTLCYLRNKIKNLNPDSILSFGEYWNSFVLLALYGYNLPIYVSDRCQPDKSLGAIHDTLRKCLYPRAKGIIIQTGQAKEIYRKILPEAKLHIIGNPIRIIAKDEFVIREKIVLSVGRLIHSKHHDELIKLFVEIKEPGWKLIIVGGNALKQKNLERLQLLVQELKAEDEVILTGSRQDVDGFYRKSKIFAFTSSSEGFPNVIGEAMSSGIPVVAFDCVAGPSEMIEDGINGYLVPLFDYNMFKNRLKSLMQDDQFRDSMSKNTVKIHKRFSKEVIADTFLKTILEES
jgi:GalNAc-alpha-(1->4)-GalNAc-alpha-(1->3)-diNAcBac-PP-undecaprenol alpha-1,4-N-acetyl-D-galactosaminyltransferase